MKISEVKIKGFRNFKDETIKFKNHSLIMGENDIGKSNLIYALRILLDRSLSELDIEPLDSDFYVHDEVYDLSIQIKFDDIVEDCIKTKFKGSISEESELYLGYYAVKDKNTGEITYYFAKGKDEENLVKTENRFDSRYYLKTLRMEYLRSSRNLENFIKKEKKNLLISKKNKRTDEESVLDLLNIKKAKDGLETTNTNINNLSYVKNAMLEINNDLENLSSHHKDKTVHFSAISESIDDIQNNLELISKVNNKSIAIGGDGKNNQIFISLWSNKYIEESESPLNVILYCVEEPEAHLHPHQQRQLSKFLLDTLKGQLIMSTHSPQIAAEFNPDSIIRLYNRANTTYCANNGCSQEIGNTIDSFGYRMSIIPAEAFFSRVVLLVEGPSEEIFYKAISYELGVEMDKYGISIINVDGVGFAEYINMLKNLNIKCVFRTDNDVFQIPYNPDKFRCAGVQRIIGLYKEYYEKVDNIERILLNESKLSGFKSKDLSDEVKSLIYSLKIEFEKIGIYISDIDLENDIYNSGIEEYLKEYYKDTDKSSIINKMQKRKAINLYGFMKKYQGKLSMIKDSDIVKPLYKCIEMSKDNG